MWLAPVTSQCTKDICDKIFKSGSSKICGRQSLKNLKERLYSFKFFKGCPPQMLLGPFLNALSHLL